MFAGLCLFFAVDNYHLWTEQDNFPFCSHGLFNGLFTSDVELYRVVVYDDQGRSAVVDPGRVLPIEWYRAVGVVDLVIVPEGDAKRKDALSDLLIHRLNDDPWYALDETYASIRPLPGARIVGLEWIRQSFDLANFHPERPVAEAKREILHRYFLPGVAVTR
jgi:hypothetical protein